MKIIINYAEKSNIPGFRIPLATSYFGAKGYRDCGYIAEVVEFNRLVLTSPTGNKIVYEVSFDYTDFNHSAAASRTGAEWAKMYRVMENIISLRLQKTVRYINRREW